MLLLSPSLTPPHSTPSLSPTHLDSGGLRSLSLSSLLVQLLDGILNDVGPEISLKVGDLSHAGHRILCAVLEDVLVGVGAGQCDSDALPSIHYDYICTQEI